MLALLGLAFGVLCVIGATVLAALDDRAEPEDFYGEDWDDD
ncbi:MAG: hypothetical protein AAGJ95_10180 [Cyanobacteria bacterium J06554_11]